MIKYPDTAPLVVIGSNCFMYLGYGPGKPPFRKRALVRRYTIACGKGPRWSELMNVWLDRQVVWMRKSLDLIENLDPEAFRQLRADISARLADRSPTAPATVTDMVLKELVRLQHRLGSGI